MHLCLVSPRLIWGGIGKHIEPPAMPDWDCFRQTSVMVSGEVRDSFFALNRPRDGPVSRARSGESDVKTRGAALEMPFHKITKHSARSIDLTRAVSQE